ncbi:type I-E CRISPR-associated protein Cse2/CasB [Kitasatospora phosalacinea]|uniref:type I-E CRISPR-associated protein Cse2/CasB n=1 Tax=Kitasatospora phosalacinea TaxID=2065 RepID=UPI003659F884
MSEAVLIEQEPPGPADGSAKTDEARPNRAEAFTAWVEQRCAADPGVRSALRRGAGKGLDQVPSMHRFVARWLPADAGEDVQRAYYTVAAMIAAQRRSQYAVPAGPEDEAAEAPEGTPDGPAAGQPEDQSPPARRPRQSLGRSFADAVKADGVRETSAETRLNMLTRQSVDGLHRHLPGAVRQLREAGARVDWALLLADLCRWRRYGGAVKRRWLQDFYRELDPEKAQQAQQADNAAGDGVREQ